MFFTFSAATTDHDVHVWAIGKCVRTEKKREEKLCSRVYQFSENKCIYWFRWLIFNRVRSAQTFTLSLSILVSPTHRHADTLAFAKNGLHARPESGTHWFIYSKYRMCSLVQLQFSRTHQHNIKSLSNNCVSWSFSQNYRITTRQRAAIRLQNFNFVFLLFRRFLYSLNYTRVHTFE